MKLLFHKIWLKNFMSYGAEATEIILDSYPLTLVSGPNGAGKTSAFMDGLCYALYGKDFRGVNIGNLPNVFNNENPVVKLWFTVNGTPYELERTTRSIKLWKAGEPLKMDVGAKDAQALLNSIIQIDKPTFKQMVLMGVHFKSFMDMDAKERRKIVEELLDLVIFSVMNQDLTGMVAINKSACSELEHEIDKLNDRIRLMEEFYNSTKTDADKERDRRLEQMENWSVEIGIHVGKREILEKKHDALRLSLFTDGDETKRPKNKMDVVRNRIYKLQACRRDINNAMSVVNKENEFLNDNTTCPTCTQPIDEGFRNNRIETNKGNNQERITGLEDLDKKLDAASKELMEYENVSTMIDDVSDQIKKVSNDILLLKQNIKNALIDIESMKKKKDITDRSECDALIKTRDDIQIKLNEEQDTKRSLEFLKLMLKDTGIKSQIVKSYIPRLNNYINDYLFNVMGVSIEWDLDENFNGKATLPKRENFEFNSFSEGEKARISLAIMFAWRQIAKERGAVDTNLLVMDEIFDGSLDDAGVESLMNILTKVNKGENYIVISPRAREFEDVQVRELRFTKPTFYTEIEEILP
jgi:DNA repair exonuclease SbcCD ATPase subunit